ncbi:MAG TPA: SGNH/GDSL hydrolase family protein [Candidatus Angelobacter sp.]|nr:SGNH/GDSL hydrolase family protein [Candidatus Angelobacter sp.]
MDPEIAALPIRDERVRRIAVSAAKGGGGLLGVGTALAGAAIGVVAIQARLARRAIGPRRSVPPYADGRYQPPADRPRGTSLRLAVLGDSGAAGLGADDPAETPGAVLARGLAAAAGRTVVLTNVAVVGARSVDLEAQVDRVLVVRPHVAMIMIGANDVTHLVRPQDAVRHLGVAVGRLRAAGTEVVVGTCPDLGTVRPIAPPLKHLARRLSRELAAAQYIAVRRSGGRPVPLAQILADAFDAEPEHFFSADRFHPSAAGYAACAEALLPEVLAAVGLGTDETRSALPSA